LATDEIKYVSFEEAIRIHFGLMLRLGETQRGIDSRDLIESALARPKHSAVYENADIIRQAATLLFGLVKNHPWTGGNKRTATTVLRRFLEINGYRKTWTLAEQNLINEIARLGINKIYDYFTGKTKIKITEIIAPEGPINFIRWDSRESENTAKSGSISIKQLSTAASVFSGKPNYPIHFDRLFSAGGNSRSAFIATAEEIKL
jgi:death-on-curing family protein